MSNSKQKGNRYERHVASFLRENGYTAFRGNQMYGATDEADVEGLPGIHIECKHYKRFGSSQLHDWYAQSMNDAKKGEIPTVWHHVDNGKHFVTLTQQDFIDMYRRAYG